MIWRPRGLLAPSRALDPLHGKDGPKPAAEAAE